MSDKIYDVPPAWQKRAFVDKAKYQEMYARSVKDPNGFWAEQAKRIDWIKPFTKVKNTSFDPHNVSIKWFEDGTLNARLQLRRPASRQARRPDRHPLGRRRSEGRQEDHLQGAARRGLPLRQRAEGARRQEGRPRHHLHADDPGSGDLHARLRAHRRDPFGGVRRLLAGLARRPHRGLQVDRSSSPPTRACAAAARFRSRRTPMPPADKAGGVTSIIVVRRTGEKVNMKAGRDVYYDEIAKTVPADCPCEEMNAEDPLFILYTSGSTGKPKGVLHTTGGYLVYTAITHQYVFDYHDGDIYWCTADVGWVTGHSYIVYGPLANGAITLMFEGVPNYPTTSRFWEVCDKHQVNIFYTAPTAIRALMQGGDDPVKKTSRKSLAPARHRRRADQSGSLGVVLPRGRRGPLPDRRHLVADRDRRHPDHAAARRDRAEARLGDAAVLRRHPADRRCRRQGARGRRLRQSVHRRFLAGPDAHGLWRPRALRADLFLDLYRPATSPATAAAATRTAITGSPAASTT